MYRQGHKPSRGKDGGLVASALFGDIFPFFLGWRGTNNGTHLGDALLEAVLRNLETALRLKALNHGVEVSAQEVLRV